MTPRGRRTARPSIRLLLTSVGRRVELVRAFRRAAKTLGIDLKIHGADMNMLAPAAHKVDKVHLVPRVGDPGYLPALLDVVTHHHVDLVIPLIDHELIVLSDAAPEFQSEGTLILISSPDVVRTCRDKLLTYKALRHAGIDTPKTWPLAKVLSRNHHSLPYYMKPRFGSASLGNFRIEHADELPILGRRVPEPIVQEFVDGVEHTLDVYTGLDGKSRCVVPRRRLEVRTGEVSKAMIVKDPELIKVGRKVADVLGNCRGVVTVQCMVTPEHRIRVIEINPRFGGGAPLSVHAGADFPLWLLSEYLGRPVKISDDAYRDGEVMLRFDESVFIRQEP